MAVEQELTPEEKLLKVIQKGEPKTVPEERTPRKETAAQSEPVEITAVAANPLRSGSGLRYVNRISTIAALVFIGLSVYETYRNLPGTPVQLPPEELIVNASLTIPVTATLNDTRDMFALRRIFGQPPPVVATNTPPPTKIANLIGWRAYARENFSLMGMSDIKRTEDGIELITREAILMDNKVKRMQFLKEGQTLIISEQEVAVSRVGETFVELKHGEEALTIE